MSIPVPFKLSKFNVIFTIIVIAFYFMPAILASQLSSHIIGLICGRVIALIFIPMLFAWLVWRMRGRQEKGGTGTYNLVLFLCIISQINQCAMNSQREEFYKNVISAKQEYQIALKSVDNVADVQSAHQKYVNIIEKNYKECSQYHDPDMRDIDSDKEILLVMADLNTEDMIAQVEWVNAYAEIEENNLLRYSLANNTEAFDRQRKYIDRYLEKTQILKELFESKVETLKKKLGKLVDSSKNAQMIIGNALESYRNQRPFMAPVFDAHMAYGEHLGQLLDLLQNRRDEWSEGDNKIVAHNDDFLEAYSRLYYLIQQDSVKMTQANEHLSAIDSRTLSSDLSVPAPVLPGN